MRSAPATTDRLRGTYREKIPALKEIRAGILCVKLVYVAGLCEREVNTLKEKDRPGQSPTT